VGALSITTSFATKVLEVKLGLLAGGAAVAAADVD